MLQNPGVKLPHTLPRSPARGGAGRSTIRSDLHWDVAQPSLFRTRFPSFGLADTI